MGRRKLKHDFSFEILNSAFERKAQWSPTFTKSTLAKSLGVSRAFVSQLFSGKRQIPLDRITDLFKYLELDTQERQKVALLLMKELAGVELITLNQQSPSPYMEYRPYVKGVRADCLKYWWVIAVLTGLSLESGAVSLTDLRERIGISASQMETALQSLLDSGLIEERDGRYQKIEAHNYIPTARSQKEIRSFHDQMILKARSELLSKITEKDFQRRMITGFTMAANPNAIESVKLRIQKFLDELSREVSDGNCTEVYQCNVQFFPLTK